MADGYKDEDLMVRYILGLATEKERRRVESQFFSEEDYFDQMVAVEEELVEKYVTGRMSPEQQNAFEKSLSRHRREDVRFAGAMLEVITKKKQKRLDLPEHAPAVPDLKLERIARHSYSTLKIAASFAVVFIATILVLFAWWRSRTSMLEEQIASLDAQGRATQQAIEAAQKQQRITDRELERERTARIESQIEVSRIRPGSAREPRDFAPIVLMESYATRGLGNSRVNELSYPQNVRFVLFQIPVAANQRHESYRVSLKQPGKAPFFLLSGLTPSKNAADLLSFTVSADSLQPEDYILIFEGEDTGRPVVKIEQYSLRVTSSNHITRPKNERPR